MAKTKYKNVSKTKYQGKDCYIAQVTIDHTTYKKRYYDERDAAVAVDKLLIAHGKEPVNILKRKSDGKTSNEE